MSQAKAVSSLEEFVDVVVPFQTDCQFVLVNGKKFLWKSGYGLDPEAITEVFGFIVKTAQEYSKKAWYDSHEVDDFIQTGFVKALEGCRKYDPLNGSFLNFIGKSVRFAMAEMTMDAPLSMTSRELEDSYKSGVPFKTTSGNRIMGEAELTELFDIIVPEECESRDFVKSIEESSRAKFVHEVVEDALSTLDDRDQFIVKGLYGIGYEEPLTASEISRQCNVSRERIRQRKEAIMRNLQNYFFGSSIVKTQLSWISRA